MSKFAIGEIASHIGAKDFHAGELVIITAVGPFPAYTQITESEYICSESADYHLRVLSNGKHAATDESMLRKLPGDSKEDFIPPEVRKLFVPNKEHEHV